MSGNKDGVDRLAPRAKPEGTPVLHQRWENLLFLHWPVTPESLRHLVPTQLELDTYDGQAWISISPFHLENVHPTGLPPLLGTGAFHEVTVRTYVVHDGVPGVWFFSLDASKTIPAMAARALFMLPYYKARIRFTQETNRFVFAMHRDASPQAQFSASWRVGEELRDPDRDSLAFFLMERYCCFAVEDGTVYQVRIYHAPWILHEAFARVNSSTLISASGMTEPSGEPLTHFARSQSVEFWPPVKSKPLNKLSPEEKLPRVNQCR